MANLLNRIVMLTMITIFIVNSFALPTLAGEIPIKLREFFRTHCLECHSDTPSKSEFRIEVSVPPNFDDAAVRSHWAEIVDVLNSHEMPPEEKPQPAPEIVAEVVDWVTTEISHAETALRENSVVMRRLNRVEYQNTIRDLTGVEFDVSGFPEDPPASGFDNIGSALTISPMQLERYLEAAEQIIDSAIVTGPQPAKVRYHFEIDSGDSDSNRVSIDGQNPIVNGGNNPVTDGWKLVHHDSWDKKLNVRDFAMKSPGTYLIRIRAAGRVPARAEVVSTARTILNERLDEQMKSNAKGERWHKEAFENDLRHFETDRIYDYGPPRLKLVLDLAGQPRTITEFDVPETLADPKVYEIPVVFSGDRAGVTIEYAYSIPRVLENFWLQDRPEFARPELLVDWIEIEGPIFPSWPPPSHRLILSEEITEENQSVLIPETIERFVRRAFRRPVTQAEIAPYQAAYEQAKTRGLTNLDSLKRALVGVLVSPNFLYLVESSPQAQSSEANKNNRENVLEPTKTITNHQLACRLSYFLWSTAPDDELMRLADSGKLMYPDVLKAQAERMLRDDRAEHFVANFTDQWLGLRDVGANPPAIDIYPHYDRHLELSMIEEGRALFRTILREDRNVLELIDPDYIVINERLARFYSISGVRGDQFRKVPIEASSHRGGVLTQSAMLTITSNGTRTSPVKRGTWILKNILGTDPGLPVANAGDIAPKVPGIDKATLRQRLEIHRQLPQCARCHNKIDPLGLALENYDASGNYREQEGFGYKGRIEKDDPFIDSSARMPDGTLIHGPAELKQAVAKQSDRFLTCLATKLLTYALGRETTLADTATIRRIVAQTKTNDHRLSAMVNSIVLSDAFRQH